MKIGLGAKFFHFGSHLPNKLISRWSKFKLVMICKLDILNPKFLTLIFNVISHTKKELIAFYTCYIIKTWQSNYRLKISLASVEMM